MTTRTEIVVTARTWIDTPFAHQGRTKGVQCDCAGLPIGVARERRIVAPDFDVTGYPPQPDGVTMIAHCRAYLVEIDPAAARFGDVLLLYFDSRPRHLGILAPYRYDGRSLIHASNVIDNPRVIEHRLLLHQRMNIRAAFSFPGVVD